MRTIINTVGTSLLTNAARELGAESPSEQQLLRYLQSHSREEASAETNSISRLFQDGDFLIFLHSQTDKGRLCADVLCRYFRAGNVQCVLESIPDLSYQESRFKMRGIRSLINAVIKLIRKEREVGRAVVLNATGGFKAEIAYATLIGLLFNVPVYYIHEAFKEIIEMPPAPISWDYALVAENEEFFTWLDEEPRKTSEVDVRLRLLPREVRLLLTEEEDETFLSPAGDIFFKAFSDLVASTTHYPVYWSSVAQSTYVNLEPSVKVLFDREIQKIRVPSLRRSGSGQVGNCDCMTYPKGHRDVRIFYFERDGGIHICELARHSDKTYERLMDRGAWKKDYSFA